MVKVTVITTPPLVSTIMIQGVSMEVVMITGIAAEAAWEVEEAVLDPVALECILNVLGGM